MVPVRALGTAARPLENLGVSPGSPVSLSTPTNDRCAVGMSASRMAYSPRGLSGPGGTIGGKGSPLAMCSWRTDSGGVQEETTALGAAYLAGLATGFWSGVDELTAQ